MVRINMGCGPHYADGWTNTDLVYDDAHKIHPDLIVTAGDPLPVEHFTDGCASKVYCGHVLEHVPWPDVPGFLAQVERVLAPDGRLAIVGPDTLRVLDRWKAGLEDWTKVAGIIEGTGAYLYWDSIREHGYEPIRWDGDRHHWNCYEARVVEALELCGWHTQPVPVLDDGRLDDRALTGWPLVADAPSQFGVVAWRD